MEGEQLKPNVGGARKLARKLVVEAGIMQPPVSLHKIITHLQSLHDLEVFSYALGENISGVSVLEEESITIGYNQREGWYRRRFTIAHEIGHFLMGHQHQEESPEVEGMRDPRETEADQFAAELLLPLKHFKTDYKAGTKDLQTLSQKYQVSRSAVSVKIMEHGLWKT